MRKNVIIFGLIAGLIVTSMMVFSAAECYKNEDYQGSMLIGYAGMLLAFSFVFVGIKNFRDKYNQGFISFGMAFKTGLYISLIASTLYVVVWLVDFYVFIPDFMDKYSAHVIKEVKASGASPIELDKEIKRMAEFKEWYKNPIFVVLITYSEVFPIGLVLSLISALILKRKPKNTDQVLSHSINQ